MPPASSNLPPPLTMDVSSIAARLGLSDSKPLIRKAEELRRLSDVHFDSSVIGIGEVCKAIICLEIAASRFQMKFDRQSAIRMSGMSEKAYMRSFNAMQNGLGVKVSLDVRELGIQFGCVRLIPFVQKGLSQYKDRFVAALPASRRANTDFGRPLKVDKLKLIELCGTSEGEFTTVSNSMCDLCFDVFGISKEKKNPKAIKGHRELLDALPSKRRRQDDDDASDDNSGDDQSGLKLSSYKRHKKMEKKAYEEWRSSVICSNKQRQTAAIKPKRQAQLSFIRKSSDSLPLQENK
ncbi:origin of replication complex subunit 6 isoform X2 [Typha latifolia]|uniref:origin of replication complex subunit 6 isoform X2 n=1 Tax=Typha latifolia TaxID=4733 RepID=UPI003C2D0C06